MDSKGFIFSMDLLLALVIVTVAIGIASDQYALLNYQVQDFTGRQSLDKTVNDAADYLVKSSGNPSNWEVSSNSKTLPGLAYISIVGSNPNFLNPKKVSALDDHPEYLYNLLQTTNYDLKLVTTNGNSWQTLIDVASPNPTIAIGNAKEVAIANRTVVVLSNQTAFSVNDLTHINPAFPGNNTGNLWYNQGGKGYFVGPGNVTTEEDPNSSFYVSANNLSSYDYYIVIDQNTGVNVVQYGFTSGDAVVNNTTLRTLPLDNKQRANAVDDSLNFVYGGGGSSSWIKLNNVNPGDTNIVNNDIQAVLNSGGGPDMKIWINIKSDPKDTISLSVIQVYKGQAPFQRLPAKLVLQVWE